MNVDHIIARLLGELGRNGRDLLSIRVSSWHEAAEHGYPPDGREWGLTGPAVGYDLGGISGGPMIQPVFINGAWSWRLVGVISEAISMEGFERVTAVRTHFILPSGKLSLE